MDYRSNEANGHLAPAARQQTGIMPPATSNSPSLSAKLLDPRAHRNHLSNGIPTFSTHCDMTQSFARHNSEPRTMSSQSPAIYFESPPPSSKDDAHSFFEGQSRGSKKSMPQFTGHTQQSYNPRQLLDPKGVPRAKACSKNDLRQSSPASQRMHERASEEPEARGMGNLIESVYGITDREERPQKRQKRDEAHQDEEEQNKDTFAGGGKGGDIGQFMREKRKEAQAESIANSTMIDLTTGTYV